MLVFTGTDRLAHHLWNAYADDTHPHHAFFLEHLHQIDHVIGEIADRMGQDDRLVLLSDHGFEALDKEVYVNYCLRQHGILFFHEGTSTRLASIDERTKAFALDPGRIYLNMQGKYPRGNVSSSDREPLIEDIEALLYSLEIEGQRVIQHIYRKEDIYSGPQMGRAPDLILLANSGFNLRATISPHSLWDRGHRTGKHSPDAFLLVSGSVDPELVPQEPSVEDVVGIILGSG
jgi:predicted AlkP superfamily phosphohydrolase/phosphomutase